MSIKSEQQARSLTTHVAEFIRDAIETRMLKSGDSVLFDQLASKLGVSRTPVREAIRLLALEGLLESIPGKGASVAALDPATIGDLYRVRETLECAAARAASQHISSYELEILQCNVKRYAENLHSANVLARLDKQFHLVIYESANNHYLEQTLKSLRVTMGLLSKHAYQSPERVEKTLSEHKRIIKALQAHDADAAETAMRNHIQNAKLERQH